MLSIAALGNCFVGCNNTSGDVETEPKTSETVTEKVTQPATEAVTDRTPITEPVSYRLSSKTKGIKILGERCLASTSHINCDWTGSGFEMDVVHDGGDMVFTAKATAPCYFRAYVDDVPWETSDYSNKAFFLVNTEESAITLKDIPVGTHRIKLIKITGYTLARAQVQNVSFCGTICETAPAKKDLYIEFVGDSICCAWGTIGNHQGTYTDQDGTLAYPLKIAERLSADYSVTALSGQGLIYGPSCSMAEGYLYPSPLRNKNKEYTFERKADIVVINIGTNDYSNRSSANIDKAKFKAAYLAFLKTVAEKNGPNCQIYCLYNTMNDTFKDAIIEAVAEFGGEEKNVYTYQMTKAASGHPTIAENEKYTEDLLKLMGLT